MTFGSVMQYVQLTLKPDHVMAGDIINVDGKPCTATEWMLYGNV